MPSWKNVTFAFDLIFWKDAPMTREGPVIYEGNVVAIDVLLCGILI